jgi:DEAD/DEAH box helicase domain-containing protein
MTKASSVIEEINKVPEIKERIMCIKTIPKKEARFLDFDFNVEDSLLKGFKSVGINRFYVHQVKAIDLIQKRKNVVISTSTSSGKSEVYYFTILKDVLMKDKGNALIIFPTKALANDQKQKFQKLIKTICPDKIASVDTFQHQDNVSKFGFEFPKVILTNFYKIHWRILAEQQINCGDEP